MSTDGSRRPGYRRMMGFGMELTDRGPTGLLERTGELEELSQLVEAASAGAGRMVVLEGPPGIGKTSLLSACGRAAAESGMVVMDARGDRLVMESSFAAVRELLWQHVELAGVHGLEGATRQAAPVFESAPSVVVDPDQTARVLHGLYWLVASLAEGAAVALLVDDAQWLDAASARFLVYLGRRLESLPVLLAVALRQGEASELAALLSEQATAVLRPKPLSEGATAALVRRALGARVDDELCRSCHEATGGNPFYLRELMTALSSAGGRPTVAVAETVRSLGVGAIGRSVLVRLQLLGSECERLAQAVAVLGPGSHLRHAAAMADLERDVAEAAADRMRSADVLDGARALSFAHPIVHEAIAAELAPSRCAGLHAKAASLLAAEGAPADRVAAHLLSAEPYGQAWVVDSLRAAAKQALAQGAPEAAVSYFRRALAEPPAPDHRLEVMVELGRAEVLLPTAHGFEALSEALERAKDPGQRAELAEQLALALISVAQNGLARIVLERMLDESSELDDAVVERLEAHLLGGGAPDLTATSRILARAGRHFVRAKRGEVREPALLAGLAETGAVTGLPAAEAAELARMALGHERLLEAWEPYLAATGALTWSDELEEAAAAQDFGIAEAQRRGSAPMFMLMSIFRAATAFRAGELANAEAYVQRGYEIAREVGTAHIAVMFLTPVLLERGKLDEACKLVEGAEFSEAELQLWQGVIVLAQRGAVRVAAGELERGVEDMLDADGRMRAAGCHLSVLTDWVPPTARALARLGRLDEARQLASRELEDAIAFGAPRRHGIALSVCGSLDGGARGLTWLEQGVEILARSPARLEHARALVNLGVGLLGRGQQEAARAQLAQGLDLAHRSGSVALCERARAELVASGARPRRASLRGTGALTPAELRTARMAGDGLSNREIAQALFVSTKTVEAQLSQAYSKLGIRGRAELAAALNTGAEPIMA